MGELTREPKRVYGIDFSGAARAGRKIWVATGVIEGNALSIQDCRRVTDLLGCGPARDECLPALCIFIAGRGSSACGLDFPFGLPRPLVREPNWQGFARSYGGLHADTDSFRQYCWQSAGRELKRTTDRETHTPFSPYNRRIYRQTYYGIRDLLAPLVRDRAACVLPMQVPVAGKPWLLEVCPASTLKRERLYLPYKGRDRRPARACIIAALLAKGDLVVPAGLQETALDDAGGDALDALVAAYAVFRALRDPTSLAVEGEDYAIEGYVYV